MIPTPSTPAPIRAAILDLDGTLCDTLGDFELALNLTLDDLRLPQVSTAFITRTVGRGSEHLLRATLAEAGGSADLYELAWARYQVHYECINGQRATVYPGIVAGLQLMQGQGWPLACVTNKPLAFARTLLGRVGLASYFQAVFGGDSFEHKKPHPMPLMEACRALGSVPGQTLMVGDSRNDAEAARAAGCPVVLLTHGYNHGEPIHEVPALAHLDRLDELLPRIVS